MTGIGTLVMLHRRWMNGRSISVSRRIRVESMRVRRVVMATWSSMRSASGGFPFRSTRDCSFSPLVLVHEGQGGCRRFHTHDIYTGIISRQFSFLGPCTFGGSLGSRRRRTFRSGESACLGPSRGAFDLRLLSWKRILRKIFLGCCSRRSRRSNGRDGLAHDDWLWGGFGS